MKLKRKTIHFLSQIYFLSNFLKEFSNQQIWNQYAKIKARLVKADLEQKKKKNLEILKKID